MLAQTNGKLKTLLGFALIVGIYIAVRFYNLTDACLWFDEIFSVHAAEHSWSELFRFVALDLIHPPLFYVLLKIWILAGGESLLWLRLFSFFFSVLAILPFLLLCRELRFSTIEQAIALSFLAVSGLLVKYTQEVRMYSVLFCLTLFAVWLFVRFLNSGSKLAFFSLFSINLLLIYTHYFGWLVVAAELAAILLWKREVSKLFAAGVCFLGMCFAPWVYAVLGAAGENAGLKQNIGWVSKPTLKNVLAFVFSLNEPFYFQQSSADPPNLLIISLPFAFVCLSLIFAAFFNAKENSVFRLPVIFVAAPIVVAFVASWLLPYSIWGARHLIIVLPAYSLLVAVALNRLRPAGLKITAFVFLGILILCGFIFQFARPKSVNIWCGWENLSAQAFKTGETDKITIYAFEDLIAYHLWFATKDSERVRVVAIKNFPGVEEDKAYFLPRGFGEVEIADKRALDGDQFWIAFRDKAWNPFNPVLGDLTARGFRFSQPLEFKAKGENAYLVKVEK